jgi:hypothetical protein
MNEYKKTYYVDVVGLSKKEAKKLINEYIYKIDYKYYIRRERENKLRRILGI